MEEKLLGNHYINNRWCRGLGSLMISLNPATNEKIWEGQEASLEQIETAMKAAFDALPSWAALDFNSRLSFLERANASIQNQKKLLIETISEETGKTLWDAESELNAVLNKLAISVQACQDRYNPHTLKSPPITSIVRHRPQGVVVVLGPFNFPMHIPNGHIVPALLAGNTVVFKSSELAPKSAEMLIQCFEAAQIPAGVIQLLHGASSTGKILSEHPLLNGLFFTGSYSVGQKLTEAFASRPGKILALEMGGNNPLIVHDIVNETAAAYHTVQSTYISSGQRCTCARRLIVVRDDNGERYVKKLVDIIQKIKVGSYTDKPEPFMGPVISTAAAEKILEKQRKDHRHYILCGDWNIAHKNIDLKNWKSNQKNSGFLPAERAWLDKLFDSIGFVDGFRVINQEPEQYTWWTVRSPTAWAKNVGWRIDYQIVSPELASKIKCASIYRGAQFSDHAPLTMEYDLESSLLL